MITYARCYAHASSNAETKKNNGWYKGSRHQISLTDVTDQTDPWTLAASTRLDILYA